MHIRDATPGEAPALAGLISGLGFPATAEEVAARLQVQAAMGMGTLVAETSEGVIGWASWSLMPVLHRAGPVGRLSMMVVTERLRGHGIGRALVEAVERRCRDLGCVLVEVTSNTGLKDAHAFYEALGYARTSYRFARTL